jgi:hypothetical protein
MDQHAGELTAQGLLMSQFAVALPEDALLSAEILLQVFLDK